MYRQRRGLEMDSSGLHHLEVEGGGEASDSGRKLEEDGVLQDRGRDSSGPAQCKVKK